MDRKVLRRALRDLRRGQALPLAKWCAECGGYVGGSLWPIAAWDGKPLGVVRCPACGYRQALYEPFQACFGPRCKRVLHYHMGSEALRAAVVLRAL